MIATNQSTISKNVRIYEFKISYTCVHAYKVTLVTFGLVRVRSLLKTYIKEKNQAFVPPFLYKLYFRIIYKLVREIILHKVIPSDTEKMTKLYHHFETTN